MNEIAIEEMEKGMVRRQSQKRLHIYRLPQQGQGAGIEALE